MDQFGQKALFAAKWGVGTDGGPWAKPPENFFGPRPLELQETPLLKIEIKRYSLFWIKNDR